MASMQMMSRRRVLAGAVALLGAGASRAAEAGTQDFGRIRVDVSAYRANAGSVAAARIAAALDASLRRHFAGRAGVRNAPDLVVSIRTVRFASVSGGGAFGFGFGSGDSDEMDGEALIVRGTTVVGRHPQLLSQDAGHGGSGLDIDGERLRLANLCNNYAAWLARAL
jgi:hypothetical protein